MKHIIYSKYFLSIEIKIWSSCKGKVLYLAARMGIGKAVLRYCVGVHNHSILVPDWANEVNHYLWKWSVIKCYCGRAQKRNSMEDHGKPWLELRIMKYDLKGESSPGLCTKWIQIPLKDLPTLLSTSLNLQHLVGWGPEARGVSQPWVFSGQTWTVSCRKQQVPRQSP